MKITLSRSENNLFPAFLTQFTTVTWGTYVPSAYVVELWSSVDIQTVNTEEKSLRKYLKPADTQTALLLMFTRNEKKNKTQMDFFSFLFVNRTTSITIFNTERALDLWISFHSSS